MFEAVVSQDGKIRTIALNGECDMQIFPDIDELLTSSCCDGFSGVRIDLRGLTFIDSTGLRALMMAKQRADSHDTKLSIVRDPPA